jgi:transcriptional regulator with XRE-family HTH domain
MPLTDLIRERRGAAKLTQAALASLVGVSEKTVARWERGEAMPPLSRASVLSVALHVPTKTLAEAAASEDT